MTAGRAASDGERPRVGPLPWFVLLCIAVGVLWGVGSAGSLILRNGTVQAGFWKSAIFELRNQVLLSGVIGAAGGVVLVLVKILLERALPGVGRALALRSALPVAAAAGLGLWPYIAMLAAGLVGGAALAFTFRSFWAVYIAVAAALGGCALLAALRWSVPRLEARRGSARAAACVAAAGAGAVFFGASLLLLADGFYDADMSYFFRGALFLRSSLLSMALLLGLGVFAALLVRTFVVVRLDGAQGKAALLAGRAVALVLAASIPALWLLGPAVERGGLQPESPMNVILIGLDTVRADHTTLIPGSVGEQRNLTPNLARLAERGTVFETAIAQAPWTLPSFASIFTGKYPCGHEAVSVVGRLKGRHVSLAEVLREAGYATAAVVSHFFVNGAHGFDQGFDSLDEDCVRGLWLTTSEDVTDRGLRFLQENKNGPFFLFLHYFDPHFAYRDHPDLHMADDYAGWLRERWIGMDELRRERHRLDAPDTGYLRDLYAEEIRYTDGQMGRILDFLESEGLAANTAVIAVGDHGEEFLEHGWLGHSISLYDSALRVPLVMALPGVEDARRRVTEPVETRAIFPTVLDYLGLSYGRKVRDLSLLPTMRASTASGASDRPEPAAFSSVGLPDRLFGDLPRVKMSSVRTARWKLIFDHGRHKKLLFDLRNDPGELVDVSGDHPDQTAALLERLQGWFDEMGGVIDEVPEDARGPQQVPDALRELGYF